MSELEVKIMGKIDEEVFLILKKSGKPLTLQEIADQMGKPTKTAYKGLKKLFEEEKIECDMKTRQYTVAKEQK